MEIVDVMKAIREVITTLPNSMEEDLLKHSFTDKVKKALEKIEGPANGLGWLSDEELEFVKKTYKDNEQSESATGNGRYRAVKYLHSLAKERSGKSEYTIRWCMEYIEKQLK